MRGAVAVVLMRRRKADNKAFTAGVRFASDKPSPFAFAISSLALAVYGKASSAVDSLSLKASGLRLPSHKQRTLVTGTPTRLASRHCSDSHEIRAPRRSRFCRSLVMCAKYKPRDCVCIMTTCVFSSRARLLIYGPRTGKGMLLI